MMTRMGRICGRHADYPFDWAIDVERDDFGWGFGLMAVSPARLRYTLSLRLTPAESQLLMERAELVARSPALQLAWHHDGLVRVKGIDITEAEARAIQGGASPLDVLLIAPWPELGYRLTAVPVPLAGGS